MHTLPPCAGSTRLHVELELCRFPPDSSSQEALGSGAGGKKSGKGGHSTYARLLVGGPNGGLLMQTSLVLESFPSPYQVGLHGGGRLGSVPGETWIPRPLPCSSRSCVMCRSQREGGKPGPLVSWLR